MPHPIPPDLTPYPDGALCHAQGFKELQLIYFFTAGEKEVSARGRGRGGACKGAVVAVCRGEREGGRPWAWGIWLIWDKAPSIHHPALQAGFSL